jgi:hypothetical protein
MALLVGQCVTLPALSYAIPYFKGADVEERKVIEHEFKEVRPQRAGLELFFYSFIPSAIKATAQCCVDHL